MKKSNFIALILGTLAGALFAIGMCMALLPEWGLFYVGVVLGGVGIVLGLVTIIIWCKMENKHLPKWERKTVVAFILGLVGTILLGVGMCLCLAWEIYLWGIIVGILGIVSLIAMVPVIKGIK